MLLGTCIFFKLTRALSVFVTSSFILLLAYTALSLSLPWHVYVINCLAETLHQQTNALLFRGYNASALSSKGSLIEHCASITKVSCCIQHEALFL